MGATPSRDPRQFWGAVAVAIGAAGVILTSALYALSPAAAALPVPDPAMPEAFQAAARGETVMWAAGTVGVLSDLVLAAGAMVLMTAPSVAGNALERLGWAASATTAIVFILVDTLVGHVLPQVAALPGGEIAFVGFKRLFDALFAFGTLAFGSASIAIFLGRRDNSVALAVTGTLAGAAGIIIGLAHLAGFNVGQPAGIFIAIGSLLFLILGVRIARRASTERRAAIASA